eukprot:CAMPEP_0113683488 /NCGR_PEP_ID=MMETSP0038_2-20120614/13344_1 /TAXON_ID=2898 /ORGANISM="Cryptomonas paramecium" /LENGTH=386 /DNA_ID=CAMNT_0000602869 /DNA_START=186 /DNA_END=1343 /DNA_ORIENTATION=- /assembly_acc=CAM_ASM_000170
MTSQNYFQRIVFGTQSVLSFRLDFSTLRSSRGLAASFGPLHTWSSTSSSFARFSFIGAAVNTLCVSVAFCDGKDETEPVQDAPRRAPKQPSFFDLLAILDWKDWLLLILAVVLTLMQTVSSLVIPSTFSAVMNATREKLDLLVPIRSFLFLQCFVIIVDAAKHFLLGILGEQIRTKLRDQLYSALLKQEITYFDFNSREFTSLLGEDVMRIQQSLTDQVLDMLTAIATLVYGSYKVVTISPRATLLVMLSFPILSLANLVAQASCRRKAQEVLAVSRANTSMAAEVLANPRTVQAFGAEEQEAERYASSLRRQAELEQDYRLQAGVAHLGFSSLNALMSAAALYYGGSLVAQGRASLEEVMQFMQYSWRVGGATGSLMSLYNDQHK